MLSKTDKTLLANVNKCFKWIEENCEGLSGEFNAVSDPYYWLKLVIEDGKAYLEYGSHGWGYDVSMSLTETAVFSRGSMQGTPYAFKGAQFFRNDRMETFLISWGKFLKSQIIKERDTKRSVRSANFIA